MVDRLEKIYKKESGRLLAYIKSKISSWEEAEDILHDVFVKALDHMNVFQSVDNLMGWLYTVCRNKVIDWYRKKTHKILSFRQNPENIILEDLVYDAGFNVENKFIRDMVLELLEESIKKLPPKQRQVIIMQAIEGKTFKQISKKTGIPINTLLAQKRYAVAALKESLNHLKNLFKEIQH